MNKKVTSGHDVLIKLYLWQTLTKQILKLPFGIHLQSSIQQF